MRSKERTTSEVSRRDALGIIVATGAALTLGVTIAGTGQDVGGDKGELATTLTIHGGRGDDERQMIDGMKFNTAQLSGGGTIRYYWVDQAAAQEVTLETSGISRKAKLEAFRSTWCRRMGETASNGFSTRATRPTVCRPTI